MFEFQRWQANLRILGSQSVRRVPYSPVSHPFTERLIGTVRCEYLDRLFFWNESDLERKLEQFESYYNQLRVAPILERSHPRGTGWPADFSAGRSQTLRLATPLQRFIRATDRRLNLNSPPTGLDNGRIGDCLHLVFSAPGQPSSVDCWVDGRNRTGPGWPSRPEISPWCVEDWSLPCRYLIHDRDTSFVTLDGAGKVVFGNARVIDYVPRNMIDTAV